VEYLVIAKFGECNINTDGNPCRQVKLDGIGGRLQGIPFSDLMAATIWIGRCVSGNKPTLALATKKMSKY